MTRYLLYLASCSFVAVGNNILNVFSVIKYTVTACVYSILK